MKYIIILLVPLTSLLYSCSEFNTHEQTNTQSNYPNSKYLGDSVPFPSMNLQIGEKLIINVIVSGTVGGFNENLIITRDSSSFKIDLQKLDTKYQTYKNVLTKSVDTAFAIKLLQFKNACLKLRNTNSSDHDSLAMGSITSISIQQGFSPIQLPPINGYSWQAYQDLKSSSYIE